MDTAAQVLGVVNLVAFTGLAAVALRQWRVRRDTVAGWAALAFGALGAVVLLGRLAPERPDALVEHVAQRAAILALLVFPYLLYRLTTAFDPASQRLARWISVLTIGLAVWTVLLPRFPAEDEPRSAAFTAYVVAFLAHWAFLAALAGWRLWRAGLGQPGVARRRLQMFAVGAVAIAIALVVATVGDDPAIALGTQILATLSALGFLLGLAPPAAVRFTWRRAEQAELQRAIQSLMGLATSQQEVAARVLGPTRAIVGARGVEVRNESGELVGSDGVPGDAASARVLTMPGGSLTVWTTPYAPFFSDEELRLLRTLGVLLGLALDRARLFGQERETRLALERADRLKTEFVALAAHELRTPVATVSGFVQTLQRTDLGLEQRAQLETGLVRQTERLTLLVEQLLDLSRLDADAVAIEPRTFPLRERVQELVASAAGTRVGSVALRIDPHLEAHADPVAFDRIVSNLVANAFHYGAPPIVIEAGVRDRHLRLVVEDRGTGVPAEFVPDLFERFTRSRNSGEEATGTGLGLAIARSYAQAHSGDLRYEPAEPTGSRFLLVLPTL